MYNQNSRLPTLFQDAIVLFSQSNFSSASASNVDPNSNANLDMNSSSNSTLAALCPGPHKNLPLYSILPGAPPPLPVFLLPNRPPFLAHPSCIPASSPIWLGVQSSDTPVLGVAEEPYSYPFLTWPTFGEFASAMRQRLEKEQNLPNLGLE